MKESIREFLKSYGEEDYDMPDHVLEVLMDDHICIIWEGIEYFVPEDNSSYTSEDYIILKYLNENNHV